MKNEQIPHALNKDEFYFNGVSSLFNDKDVHKIGVLGDTQVGKSTLVDYWTQDEPPIHEDLLSFRVISHVHTHGDFDLPLTIMDLCTSLNLVHSKQIYKYLDVILLCYSVDDRKGFEKITTVWASIISEHCTATKTILLATKIDLRDDPVTNLRMIASQENPVTEQEGKTLASEQNFAAYHECSVKNDNGVAELFTGVAELILY